MPDTSTQGTGGTGSGGASSGTSNIRGAGGSTGSGGGAHSGGSTAAGGTSGAGGASKGSGGTLSSGGGSGSGGRADAGSLRTDAGADANQDADAPSERDAALIVDSSADHRSAEAASLVGTNNPVLPGLWADPNVVLFDDTFYIFPTTDGVADWGATSFSAFSSTNLVQWTNRGVILDVPKDLTWATGHAWAPSAARAGSTYYFYFSADTQIGVATSTSPTGPFKDALGHPLVTKGQYGPQSIDPYVFIDDDGSRYLYFGSGSSGLYVARLNEDMISFTGTPTNISPSGASGTLEGSAMFKRKGTYYLQWSEGDTRQATYRVAYGHAQSPTGPFTRLAVILEQDTKLGILGPGGSTVLAIASRDEYYIVYHRFKISGGDGTHRETCIDRLSFNGDGTIIPVKPTLEGLQAEVEP